MADWQRLREYADRNWVNSNDGRTKSKSESRILCRPSFLHTVTLMRRPPDKDLIRVFLYEGSLDEQKPESRDRMEK